MNQKAEKGFVHLAMILTIVAVLAAVGFGAWYVWDKNKPKQSLDNSQKHQEDKAPDSTDETADWVSVTTQGGAFSMKVPDGWKLTKYPDNFLGSVDVMYSPGTRATIETSDKEYVGHLLRFSVRIVDKVDIGLEKPWESPQPGLEESTEEFAIGELKGKRYKGRFTYDINETHYVYAFDLHNGEMLQASYTIYHNMDNKDDVVTAEKALETIQIN